MTENNITVEEYEQNLINEINRYRKQMEYYSMVVKTIGPKIEQINRTAYEMMLEGASAMSYYANNSLNQAEDALQDLHESMVKRSLASRKAAATRKANKAKVA